jgi:putative tricarboxylic transport membrane protein
LLTGENPVKGYISMVLGLMIAMVGFDIISGDARYAFGIPEMMDGVDFLPVAIGLFGLGEVLAGAEAAKGTPIAQGRYGLRDVMPNAADWARSRWAIVRGTVLGFAVGILPAPARRSRPSSRTRSRRRSRSTRGIRPRRDRGRRRARVGQQRRSDRCDGADADAGHPGLGDDRHHARRPDDVGAAAGPLLFEKNPEFVWGLIASQYIANVMLLILSTACIRCSCGAAGALRHPDADHHPVLHHRRVLAEEQRLGCRPDAGVRRPRLRDEEARLLAGGADPGARLGPLAERALRQSLIISDAGIGIFFMRPISAVLTVPRWRRCCCR